jgi:hypothetical protein
MQNREARRFMAELLAFGRKAEGNCPPSFT